MRLRDLIKKSKETCVTDLKQHASLKTKAVLLTSYSEESHVNSYTQRHGKIKIYSHLYVISVNFQG